MKKFNNFNFWLWLFLLLAACQCNLNAQDPCEIDGLEDQETGQMLFFGANPMNPWSIGYGKPNVISEGCVTPKSILLDFHFFDNGTDDAAMLSNIDGSPVFVAGVNYQIEFDTYMIEADNGQEIRLKAIDYVPTDFNDCSGNCEIIYSEEILITLECVSHAFNWTPTVDYQHLIFEGETFTDFNQPLVMIDNFCIGSDMEEECTANFNISSQSECGEICVENNSTGESLTYIWTVYNDQSDVIEQSASVDFCFTPPFSGLFIVELLVSNENGCESTFTQEIESFYTPLTYDCETEQNFTALGESGCIYNYVIPDIMLTGGSDAMILEVLVDGGSYQIGEPVPLPVGTYSIAYKISDDCEEEDIFCIHVITIDCDGNPNCVLPDDLPWDGSTCFEKPTILNEGIAAVTCAVDLSQPVGTRFTFAMIDLNASIPTSGQVVIPPAGRVYHHPSWTVDQIGDVYGIAIRETTAEVFLTASSNFSSGFYTTNSTILQYGVLGGGADDLNAAGTIYRIHPVTGQASVFSVLPQQLTNVTHGTCESGTPQTRNTGVGLGNICHDEARNLFYVTNIEDGRIYLIDGVTGNIKQSFDPFTQDDGVPGISIFDETPYGIALEPGTNRLFFGLLDSGSSGMPTAPPGSPSIYSIDLNPSGDFIGTVISNAAYPVLQGVETLHTSIPTGTGFTFSSGGVSYLISDLDFTPDGNLLAGVRVACKQNFHTSYNHWGETNVIAINSSTGLYDSVSELDISVQGAAAPEDSYGGVASYKLTNGDVHYLASSADIIDELGPHGIAIWDASTSNVPLDPLAAFSYGVLDNGDPKGMGGDVEIFGSCTSISTANCDSLMVMSHEAIDIAEGCCHFIDIKNNYGSNVIELEIEILSPEWQFNLVNLDPPFTFGSCGTLNNKICIQDPVGGNIPSGTSDNALMTCFSPTVANPTTHPLLEFSWKELFVNSAGEEDTLVVCIDSLLMECDIIHDSDCFAIIDDSIECLSEENPLHYEYCFTIQNNSGEEVGQIVIEDLDPGFSFLPFCTNSKNVIPTPNPLADGAISDQICVQIKSTIPITKPRDLCFSMGLIASDGSDCCHHPEKICKEIIPCCDPCEDKGVLFSAIEGTDENECCYSVGLVNECVMPFFTKVEAVINTPGVCFGSHVMGAGHAGDWGVLSSPQSICMIPNSGTLDQPIYNDLFQFCLDKIDDTSQANPTVTIKWYAYDPLTEENVVVCEDILDTDCPAADNTCVIITNGELECIPDSNKYRYTFTVKNTSNPGFVADKFHLNVKNDPSFEAIPSGPVMDLVPPLAPGDSVIISTCIKGLVHPAPFSDFIFGYRLQNKYDGDCCFESVCDTIPVPSCDPCCDEERLDQELNDYLSTLVVEDCKVSFGPIENDSCLVASINWGVSNSGDFYGVDSLACYSYDQSGVYNICLFWELYSETDEEPCVTKDTCILIEINGECQSELPEQCGWMVSTCYGTSTIPDVAVMFDTRLNSAAPAGQDWNDVTLGANQIGSIHPTMWNANAIGQVFGIALDDNGGIYFGASDEYNAYDPAPLPLSGPAGRGGIYYTDYNNVNVTTSLVNTVNVAILNTVGTNTIPNSGGARNGIGNLAFDSHNQQLFVTNLEDGRIYRIDHLSGNVLSIFDPLNLDNGVSGIASLGERVYGIGIYRQSGISKVYYAISNSPSTSRQIHSIALDASGEFMASTSGGGLYIDSPLSSIVELANVPGTQQNITDIAFSSSGRMLLAERGNPHDSRTLEYFQAGGIWNPGNNFLTGQIGGENTAGGVDYGAREMNDIVNYVCDDIVWSSMNWARSLTNGCCLYGAQGIDAAGSSNNQTLNYANNLFIDYNNNYNTLDKGGIGDLELFKCGCPPDVSACDSLMVMAEQVPNVCIDSSLIDGGPCPLDFNPVCGCDGNTYSNACHAGKAGITTIAPGECNGENTPEVPNLCCYDIDIKNNYGPNIVELEVEMLTPEWIFNTTSLAAPFTFGSCGSLNDKFCIQDASSGSIPAGTSIDAIITCFVPVVTNPTTQPIVEFKWKEILGEMDTLVTCRDTLDFICELPPVDSCLVITNDTISCLGEENPLAYQYCFQITNNTSDTVSQIVIDDLTTGFSFLPFGTNSKIVIPTPNPLPPGATSQQICVQVSSSLPITQPQDLCMKMGLIAADGSDCCHSPEEICIEVEPCCDPCEDKSVTLNSISGNEDEDCCYSVDITNECAMPYFTKIEAVINTPGVCFGSHVMGAAHVGHWNVSSTATSICMEPLGGIIDQSSYQDLFQFCLDKIDDSSQANPTISIKWYASDPITGEPVLVCEDQLDTECPASDNTCVIVSDGDLVCLPDSNKYRYTFKVKNVSNPGFAADRLHLNVKNDPSWEPVPSGPVIILNPPLAPGDSTIISTCIFGPTFPAPFTDFVFGYRLENVLDGDCCFESKCDTLSVPPCTDCIPTEDCVEVISTETKDVHCEKDDCYVNPYCLPWLRDIMDESTTSGCQSITDYSNISRAMWNGQTVFVGNVNGEPDGGGYVIWDCEGTVIQSCFPIPGDPVLCQIDNGVSDLMAVNLIWSCVDILPDIYDCETNDPTTLYTCVEYCSTIKNNTNPGQPIDKVNLMASTNTQTVYPSEINLFPSLLVNQSRVISYTVCGDVDAGDQFKINIGLENSDEEWCCNALEPICLDVPPCDDCCDEERLDQELDDYINTLVVEQCKVSFGPVPIDTCSRLTILWGDNTGGVYGMDSIACKTYDQSGTVNICFQYVSFPDMDDVPCYVKDTCILVEIMDCDNNCCDEITEAELTIDLNNALNGIVIEDCEACINIDVPDCVEWDLFMGDGVSITNQTGVNQICHNYGSSGSYFMTLVGKVYDDSGEICYSVSVIKEIEVECDDCCDLVSLADLTSDLNTALNTVTTIDCEACITVPVSECVEWDIDWGDGTTMVNQSGTQTLCHDYNLSGSFIIALIGRVYDADGMVCHDITVSKEIVVECDDCCDGYELNDLTTDVQGALASIDTMNCNACLTGDFPECVEWTIDWNNGGNILEQLNGQATRCETYTDGLQTICVNAKVYDDNGVVCFEYEECVDITIDCNPPVGCVDCPDGITAGPNLVVNGDFEGGAIGFNSGHSLATNILMAPGEYDVRNSALLGNWFWDNTANSSNFLQVDGQAGTIMWSQNINVLPNENYIFCAEFDNLVDPSKLIEGVAPRISIRVNGATIGGLSNVAIDQLPDALQVISTVWNSGSVASPITLEIFMNVVGSYGDIAIDNISFSQCGGCDLDGDPCEFTSLDVTATDDECCYEVEFDNQYCENYFKGFMVTTVAPNFVSQIQANAGWFVNHISSTVAEIYPTGTFPMGSGSAFTICGKSGSNTIDFSVSWLVPNGDNCDEVCEQNFSEFCMPPPPAACITIIDDIIDCDQYCFRVTNNTSPGFTINSIVLDQLTPTGALLNPNPISIPALAPGATSSIICVDYVNLLPGETFCYNVIAHDKDITQGELPTWCCTDTLQKCATVPDDCSPCDDLSIITTSAATGDTCCWTVDIINNYDDDSFVGIKAKVLTPGVYFANINTTVDWSLNYIAADEYIFDYDAGTGHIPLGANVTGDFCLTGYTTSLQQVEFSWLQVDPMTGDTVEVCPIVVDSDCPAPPPPSPCTDISDVSIDCVDTLGNYTLQFNLSNNTNLFGTGYNALSYHISNLTTTGGVSLTPISNNLSPVLMPGQTTTTPEMIAISGAMPGDSVCFSITLHDQLVGGAFSNCCTADTVWCFVIPSYDPCIDAPDCCSTDNYTQADLQNDVSLAINNAVLDSCELCVEGDFPECVLWSVDFGEGSVSVTPSMGVATECLEYDINGNYTACLTAYVLDENGDTCLIADQCIDVIADCDPDCCPNYSQGLLDVDVMSALDNAVLDNCTLCIDGQFPDCVNWYVLYEGDNGPVPIGSNQGSTMECWEYQFPGTYTACLFAFVLDEQGDTCLMNEQCIDVMPDDCDSTCCDITDDEYDDLFSDLLDFDREGCNTICFYPEGEICDLVTIDFGDGNTVGPIGGDDGICHVYANDSTYNLCVTMYRPDIDDPSINCVERMECFDVEVMCDTTMVDPPSLCDPSTWLIPNGLTPNGDGFNEELRFTNMDDCRVNLKIYNRWGQMVYVQNDYATEWHGQSENGEPLPDGTYYLLIGTDSKRDGSFDNFITRYIDLRRE